MYVIRLFAYQNTYFFSVQAIDRTLTYIQIMSRVREKKL